MKISIIGAGRVGGTLARKWAAASHQIVLGVRDVNSSKVRALIETSNADISADDLTGSIAFGEVVLMAVPSTAVSSIVAAHASALDSKIIIDATNRFGSPEINNLSVILAQAPNASVFRAFNSLGWNVFADPQFGDLQADLFYCGPQGQTRSTVEQLITEVGLRPIYVGGLDQINLVDNLGALWINLARKSEMGREIAFKLLQRD